MKTRIEIIISRLGSHKLIDFNQYNNGQDDELSMRDSLLEI